MPSWNIIDYFILCTQWLKSTCLNLSFLKKNKCGWLSGSRWHRKKAVTVLPEPRESREQDSNP